VWPGPASTSQCLTVSTAGNGWRDRGGFRLAAGIGAGISMLGSNYSLCQNMHWCSCWSVARLSTGEPCTALSHSTQRPVATGGDPPVSGPNTLPVELVLNPRRKAGTDLSLEKERVAVHCLLCRRVTRRCGRSSTCVGSVPWCKAYCQRRPPRRRIPHVHLPRARRNQLVSRLGPPARDASAVSPPQPRP
jgi:hypothetical protein